MNDGTSPRRILIVTVHGTNDGKHGAVADTKWWEKNSEFVGKLSKTLESRNIIPEFDEHLWGGANSALARETGARSLARKLRDNALNYSEIHIIGHSHGGNVAVSAAERLSWGKQPTKNWLSRKPPKITSLTTVGTPFMRPKASSAGQIFSQAFAVLLLLCTMTFLAFPAFTAIDVVGSWRGEPPPPTVQFLLSSVFAVLATLSALLFLQQWSRVRFTARLSRRDVRPSNLLTIRHVNDEAIGGLMRAEKFDHELSPKGALSSSARRMGLKVSSVVFVASGLLLALLFFSLFAMEVWAVSGATKLQGDLLGPLNGLWARRSDLRFLAIFVTSLIASCGLLSAACYAVFLFAGLVFELLRGRLNAMALDTVRKFALGSDAAHRTGDVSAVPHQFQGREWIIGSPLAETMETLTLDALSKFVSRHRSALFGDVISPDSIARIGEDGATWDSLIHTTYFDHDEICMTISDHIASSTTRNESAGSKAT